MWTNEQCMDCQWCCRVANVPIPGGLEFAYLYWWKGRKVYWEPLTKEWYWLADDNCQYIGLDGCKCYENRPTICKTFYCPFGPYWIHERFEILCDAGDRIMREYERRGTFHDRNTNDAT